MDFECISRVKLILEPLLSPNIYYLQIYIFYCGFRCGYFRITSRRAPGAYHFFGEIGQTPDLDGMGAQEHLLCALVLSLSRICSATGD